MILKTSSVKNKMKSAFFSLFFFTLLPSFSIATEIIEETISPPIMQQVKTVIHEYFESDLEKIQITLLTGGYSATSIRLDFADKSYVLRVISELEPSHRVNAELYAMKKASEAGIAPKIHWISKDGRSILMDYIPGGTLTIEHSKKPEVIATIADLLRKVHASPKNPFNAPSFIEHMEKFYIQYSQGSKNSEIWETAISIIRQGSAELQKLESPSVNTHGDLSPRNILVTLQTIYFIDWSEEMYTEPFLDLGYFSVLMDYSPHEENLLLKNYLLRNPTTIEKKRFCIAKKMNFGRLALGGLYISNKLGTANQDVNSNPYKVKEWSFYAKAFANNDDSLTSQFFWNLAQAAIESANAINVHNFN